MILYAVTIDKTERYYLTDDELNFTLAMKRLTSSPFEKITVEPANITAGSYAKKDNK